MKFRSSLLITMAVLLLTVGAIAKATFSTASGLLLPAGNVTEGVVNCQGQVQPTGVPTDPCPGVRGTIRGRVATGTLTTLTGAPHDGPITITVNINFGPDRKGNMWGTFVQQTGGGVVEGTYTGNIDLATYATDYETVGHGRGGTVDGLQIKTEGHPSATINPAVAEWVARILDPGKN